MKARADLQQTSDAPAKSHPADGRFHDARENFQQRRFARAISTNDAHHFPGLYFKFHVLQSPEVFAAASVPVHVPKRPPAAQPAHRGAGEATESVAQGFIAAVGFTLVADAIAFAQIVDVDCGAHG